MFKLLLIAGHGRNMDGSWDPGAIGNGYQEADLNRELTKLVKQAADNEAISCDIAPDRNHYSYFKHGGEMDFSAYTYVLEIHFNAAVSQDNKGDGIQKGSMFYISASETGHSVEDSILNELYQLGSVKAWDGVVTAQRQWPNGLMVQEKVRAQNVSHGLLETCFITDFDDISWYLINKSKIAKGIIQGIIKGFQLKMPEAFAPYMVQVDVDQIYDHHLNIRKEPSADSEIAGKIMEKMSLTIVEETHNQATGETWGRLKSGAGWINLAYTKRI